jgi:shikimate dehydrogenase
MDTQLYGVVGFPVKHSLSPAMHNAAFSSLGIQAEYRLFEVKPEELGSFFNSLRQKNIHGLNITVPHKQTAIVYMDTLSDEARLIGAVNTVKVTERGLEGFNTDGEGFLKHLVEDLKFDPAGKAISVIGAGGGAKAILVYLARQKPKCLIVYDIDQAKLTVAVRHLRENMSGVEIVAAKSIPELKAGSADLLINATPVGMKPADPCLVNDKHFRRDLLVYDLIYNPPKTTLLEAAQKKNARISNGLGMLLYQGMSSFEIWTGQKAPKEIMYQALLKALEK